MIHLQDASFASSAMVSSIRLVLATPLAISPVSAPLLFFDETWKAWQIAQDVLGLVFPVPLRWNGARTCAHGTGVANEQHSSKAIHCCHLPVSP